MSGESTLHIRLVESLERHVLRTHGTAANLLVLLDHDRYGRDRPRRYGGYCPDLFASDLPATFEIIGEAKTSPDMERPHTHRQLVGFLDHLALRPGSFLYVCVPHPTVARAGVILKRLLRPEHSTVTTAVIAGE